MATEFEILTARMNEGFRDLIDKLDSYNKAFYEHQIPCQKEFAAINTKLDIKAAVNCVENKQAEKERDWGKWAVRLFLALLAAGMIGLWFK